MDKLLLRVEEVAELLDVGRTRVYQLISCGDLRSIKIGGSRRIPSTAVQHYLDRMLDGAAHSGAASRERR
jgi:excisionase family DNA binding protein